MRVLFYLTAAVILIAILGPPGCRRVREHVLLSLVRDSERPVEITDDEPLVFRFPPTEIRAVALIDYQDALASDGHLSFVPPDGSPLYLWAAGVCPMWSSACLDAVPARTLSEITYGELPPGLHQIEPTGGGPTVAPFQPGRLYGLALFGTRLFVLKAFVRDAHGIRMMDGSQFAEAVVHGHRDELRAFVDAH
jgi:hypothetical protein